jgi:hypothetical protein
VAHIEKRSERRYRVRYRDPAGAERSKTFARLTEARRFKATIEDELGRNLWIDPRAARMTFEEFTTTLGPSEGSTSVRRLPSASQASCAARCCQRSAPCP